MRDKPPPSTGEDGHPYTEHPRAGRAAPPDTPPGSPAADVLFRKECFSCIQHQHSGYFKRAPTRQGTPARWSRRQEPPRPLPALLGGAAAVRAEARAAAPAPSRGPGPSGARPGASPAPLPGSPPSPARQHLPPRSTRSRRQGPAALPPAAPLTDRRRERGGRRLRLSDDE